MNLKLVGILMLGLILAAASAVPTHESSWEQERSFSDDTDFFYAGDDNEEASAVLARSLRRAGDGDWEVSLKGEWLTLKEDGNNWVLEPKVSIDGPDRIVVKRYLAGKSSRAADERACLALVNKMNGHQNVVAFTVDEDGDLEIRYSFDYRNSLSVGQLYECLDYFGKAVALAFLAHQDELEIWFQ